MLRTARSLPLHRALDAGLRPDPFPDRAASLLPGLLAATRTGLTPAGDDELMLDRHSINKHPPTLGALCGPHNSPGTSHIEISRSGGRRPRLERVKWTVHPPSKPVPGALPPSRGSGPALPQRLERTA